MKKKEHIVKKDIGQRHHQTDPKYRLTISADSRQSKQNFQLFAACRAAKREFLRKVEERSGREEEKKRVVTFLRVFFVDERVDGQRTTRNKR